MKMKEVIAQTGLTDRAVRLYISNGLVSPAFDESYAGRKRIDFSENDIDVLQKIAVLRKAGFSLAQIKAVQSGGENAKNAVDALIEEKTAKQKHSETVLSALKNLPRDEAPTMELICLRLTESLTETPVPTEDLKPTVIERIEKFTQCTLAIVVIALICYIYLSVKAQVKTEYRYPTLDTPLMPHLLPFLLLPFIPSVIILIFYKLKIFSKRKRFGRRIAGIVLCIINALVIFGVILMGGLFLFICPYSSQTEDPTNYLMVDKSVDFYRESIYRLFPPTIPDSATGLNKNRMICYPNTTTYYYRYAYKVEAELEINAQWVLPEDEYAAEKERIHALHPRAVKQEGDWVFWYFDNTDEDQKQIKEIGYFSYLTFAFNNKTRMVRYIMFSCVDYQPDYQTLHYKELEW